MVLGWSEQEFQDQVIAAAQTLGWRHFHTYDSRRSPSGWPDLVLVNVRQGRLLFRELKTERGRVSPAQEVWLAHLVAVGQDAAVWRPRDWVSGRVQRELAGP